LLVSQFLDSKKEKVLAKAVSVLSLLSAMKDFKDLFPESDAICALVPLLDFPDEGVRKYALISLANLADHGTYILLSLSLSLSLMYLSIVIENSRKITFEEDGLVPILKALSELKDPRLTERLIWAVSYYAQDGKFVCLHLINDCHY